MDLIYLLIQIIKQMKLCYKIYCIFVMKTLIRMQ